MNQPVQPSRWQVLKQTFLAPAALASAIEAGLGWAFPALIIFATVTLLGLIALPLFTKALPQMVPQGLSPAMMAQFERTSRIMRPIQILISPIGLMIRWAITASLLYLMSILVNRRSSFRNLFVLVVYGSLILLVEVVVKNMLLWFRYAFTGTVVMDPPIGLEALFQPKGAVLSTLLQHASLFEVWYLIVLIAGIHALCRCRKRLAAAIVLPAWGFWLLGHVVYAMVKEVLVRQLGT